MLLPSNQTPSKLISKDLALSEVADEAILQEIFALRIIAWRGQATIPPDVANWTDPIDLLARHWAIFYGERPIASARLSMHMKTAELPDAEIYSGILLDVLAPIGSINRCVVHPDFRHLGLAKELVKVRIAAARTLGCRMIVVSVDDESGLRRVLSCGFRKIAEAGPYPDGPIPGKRGTICTMEL
jgi:GNAT superfamily N-acetyltransferase